MTIKKEKYKKAGVREYWMVDTQKKITIVCEFEKEKEDKIYEVTEKVPVGIYDGKCEVDFQEIYDFIESW